MMVIAHAQPRARYRICDLIIAGRTTGARNNGAYHAAPDSAYRHGNAPAPQWIRIRGPEPGVVRLGLVLLATAGPGDQPLWLPDWRPRLRPSFPVVPGRRLAL